MNRASLGALAALSAAISGSAGWSPGAPGPGPCGESARWETLVLQHLGRYERMLPADLYKLLHQAALGSEHAAPRPETALAWLEDEVARMGDGPIEPLADTLGPRGGMVRIHLRPFVARGGSLRHLAGAFLDTARRRGDVADLECALAAVGDMAEEGRLPWPAAGIDDLLAEVRAQGYPAMHHSARYAELYRPAYRVIAADLVTTALPRADVPATASLP